MEANQFEKQAREKLENRTIQPSEMAWSKLDAMLTVGEEKQPKRGFGWLYIAASIAGFVLIATVFFSQTEELIDKRKDAVVIENKNQKQPEIKASSTVPSVIKQPETVAQNESSSNKINKSNPIIHQSKSVKEALRTTDNHQPAIRQTAPDNQIAENIDQKADQLNPKTAQTNADELLANAEKSQKRAHKAISIDADYMLSQADGGDQPDPSAREKFFARVNQNYHTVKTALANRNNE